MRTKLTELRYVGLQVVRSDLTDEHLDLMVEVLEFIDRNPVHGLTPSAQENRRKVGEKLKYVNDWVDVVQPALTALRAFLDTLSPVIDDVNQITEWLDDNERTRNRKTHRSNVARFADSVTQLAKWRDMTLRLIRNCSVRELSRLGNELGQLDAKKRIAERLAECVIELGGNVQDDLPSDIVPAPKLKLSPAEQDLVTNWERVTVGNRGSILENQVRKLKERGDFVLLQKLTSIVDHIQRNRNATPLRFGGVDLNVHALKGGLSGNTSFDFPFLNKTRLGSTNRGVWRIIFKGTVIAGLFDDHSGSLVGWKGEGLQLTRIP